MIRFSNGDELDGNDDPPPPDDEFSEELKLRRREFLLPCFFLRLRRLDELVLSEEEESPSSSELFSFGSINGGTSASSSSKDYGQTAYRLKNSPNLIGYLPSGSFETSILKALKSFFLSSSLSGHILLFSRKHALRSPVKIASPLPPGKHLLVSS